MQREVEVLTPWSQEAQRRQITLRVFASYPVSGIAIERLFSSERDFRLVDEECRCDIGVFVWEAESLTGKLLTECSRNPEMRCLLFLPGFNRNASLHLRIPCVWGVVTQEFDVAEAARAIATGRLWVDLTRPSLNDSLSKRLSMMHQLTFREREIVLLIGEAHPNKEIAYRLQISERTVKFHMSNILRKTQSSSRRELLNKLSLEI